MKNTFKKIGKWKILFLTLSILLLVSWILWPTPPAPPETISNLAEFETYLNKIVELGKPPALSLAVVKNGNVIYRKGFGRTDPSQNITATSESVYHWWSITKIVTAIAILQLQEQGKLQLDDSVKKYLPFFNVQYPSANSKVITIHHLLTHSSGLPDAGIRIIGWIHHDGDPPVNQTALVKKVFSDYSTLEFESGNYSQYTNIGYMVLGAIIEKVTNQAYETYIKEHILEPLGMHHTDFQYTKAMEPYEVAGSHPILNLYTPLLPFFAGTYIREISGNHIWLTRVYNDQTPPSGLIGSVSDAARLVAAYLNGGELDGQRILSRESIMKMTYEGHIKGKTDELQLNCWQGIGWQIYNSNGQLVISHGGGGPGFRTEMWLYPDKKLGFVLFTNDAMCEVVDILHLAEKLNW